VLRWLESRLGTLSRAQTVALVAAGLVVATAVSEATDTEGPLGPAGVFFALVLLVGLFGGATAGLAATALGTAVIAARFTHADELADLGAFVLVGAGLSLVLGRLSQATRDAQQAAAQVDAMVRNAPVGIAFVDRDLRYLEINDTLAGLSERTAAEMVGRRLDELPGMPPEVPEIISDVIRTGVSKLDVPFVRPGDAGRDEVRVAAGYYPVRGSEGEITGVGIVVREITAEHQRDLLFARVTRLQELTAALSVAGSVEEVVRTAVRSVQHAVDARAAVFVQRFDEDDTVRVIGSIGHDAEIVEPFRVVAVDRDLPITEAVRTNQPVVCGTMDDALARYPELREAVPVAGTRALAAIPLRSDSHAFGAIGISFGEPRAFDADEVAFLVAAATQCATAFERATAFEAERSARRAAEDANRRLEYLSEATKVLSQSLDPETTMQRLAELSVPTLADWCAVHIVEGDHAHPVAMASENPEATAMVRSLSERNPIPLNAPAGLGAVARTGEPVVVRSVTMDAVRASTDEGEVVDLLSRLRSIAIVPMMFHGTVLGTVTLSNTSDRTLEDADIALASELAARAAQAVTNARLFQERTRVAATLQASLLPPSHPIIPGVDVASRFVPASEGLDVGGDFYDVFRLGTIEEPAPSWALVIGDVRGKGADAAAITGIARATIRAAALDETSPARMLDRLNQVLLATASDDRFASQTGEPQFCTACVITITPATHGADLVVASGGHPLPYVLRVDGIVEQIGEHGGLIGVMPSPAIVDVRAHLVHGDSLVLYTDGVTERHEGTVFFDEDGLASVLADCAGFSAIDTAVRVEVAARGFVDAVPRDDLAVVVARIPEKPACGTVARRVLPDGERAAAVARRFVADALRELATGSTVDTAALLASELVTNAVVHGTPPVDVSVLAIPDGFRVAVGDEHPDVPTPRHAMREDEHGRGLLLVDRLSDRWGVDARPPGKIVWFELAH